MTADPLSDEGAVRRQRAPKTKVLKTIDASMPGWCNGALLVSVYADVPAKIKNDPQIEGCPAGQTGPHSLPETIADSDWRNRDSRYLRVPVRFRSHPQRRLSPLLLTALAFGQAYQVHHQRNDQQCNHAASFLLPRKP
jgi:hypothetical protein